MPTQTWSDGAPPGSRGIPMVVGITKDEGVDYLDNIGDHVDTDAEVARRLHGCRFLPDLPDADVHQLIKTYRDLMPPETTRRQLLVAMVTDLFHWHSVVKQAEIKVASDSAPVFCYEFSWRTPCFGDSWAIHSVELPFIFGNLTYGTAWDGEDNDAIRAKDDPAGDRFRLSREIMSAWASFAHHGDPSVSGLPWPAYDLASRHTMVFGRKSSTPRPDHTGTRRRIIERFPLADDRASVHLTHFGVFEAESDGTSLTSVRPWTSDPDPRSIIHNVASSQHHPTRVMRPAIRCGWLTSGPGAPGRGDEPFVEVSWDEALRLLAGNSNRCIATSGRPACSAVLMAGPAPVVFTTGKASFTASSTLLGATSEAWAITATALPAYCFHT